MKNPITKLAAVASIIIVVFLVLSFAGGPDMTSVTWGKVVEAFNGANNVHIIKTSILDQGVAVKNHEAWIKNQTLFRVEADHYRTVDDGQRVLTLYKGLKVAHIRDSFTPYWDYTALILKVFRDALLEKGITVTKSLSESTEAADVYEIDFRGRWRGKAWVEQVTNLPLRIAGNQTAYTGQKQAFEMNFDYETIPDEMFSTSIPTGCTELPNLMYEDMPEGREDRIAVLSGVVVDSQGNPAPDARIFASYAAPGRTDSEGAFALVAPPTDNSRTIGPVDFPIFVWAYTDDDPYSLAWSLIRCPLSDEAEDPDENTERTHQGVELVIGNEDELIRDIPDQGVFSDDKYGSQVHNIMLVTTMASVITGQVTKPDGTPLANAVVQAEMIQLQIGSSTLKVEDLDDEWKAGFLTLTDSSGNYTLGHLPASWSRAALVVRDKGHELGMKRISSTGQTTACAIAITKGLSDT